ncbi:hypothetical protein [Streptomyces iconiensis]|uniref:Uncharacterized protein n=1 Tax=Streptomyces iconiensis TaxID=1384038 RepID=A0ABT7A078_9ACTN|nr:hypothetical protein [Streptomyces iconiensis]MDJ1134738.1 hypothetical protein [Streptomyces iconiensis]
MSGGVQVRARWMAVALVGLLLAMCGAAVSGSGAVAVPAAATGSGAVSGSGAVPDAGAGADVAGASGFGSGTGAGATASPVYEAPVPADAPIPAADAAPTAGHAATSASASTTVPSSVSAPAAEPVSAAHVAREQADDGAVDPGPSRCHKSKDDGQGTLPSAPSSSNQQSLPFVLAACLTPESHSALGAAHARPPVRGPAPAPPPTPVELSVLRV